MENGMQYNPKRKYICLNDGAERQPDFCLFLCLILFVQDVWVGISEGLFKFLSEQVQLQSVRMKAQSSINRKNPELMLMMKSKRLFIKIKFPWYFVSCILHVDLVVQIP